VRSAGLELVRLVVVGVVDILRIVGQGCPLVVELGLVQAGLGRVEVLVVDILRTVVVVAVELGLLESRRWGFQVELVVVEIVGTVLVELGVLGLESLVGRLVQAALVVHMVVVVVVVGLELVLQLGLGLVLGVGVVEARLVGVVDIDGVVDSHHIVGLVEG